MNPLLVDQPTIAPTRFYRQFCQQLVKLMIFYIKALGIACLSAQQNPCRYDLWKIHNNLKNSKIELTLHKVAAATA